MKVRLCGSLPSPEEFRSRWDGDVDSFIRFPLPLLASFGVSQEDSAFQLVSGVPSWAAPNMHFFYDGGDQFPRPEDDDGSQLEGDMSEFGQIGSTGEGFPICLKRGGGGEIICINPDEPGSVKLLNSSFTQLLATLLAINEMVSKAISYGEANGVQDAWRKKQYPRVLDDELEVQIRAIDHEAVIAGSYWSSALHN
jgi:hypothetical protein